MNFNLKPGISFKNSKVVKKDMLASSFGSGAIKVLATPVMVGLIEEAALLAVDNYLPDGYATVGYKVNVDHLAPTPLGMEVRAEARLEDIEERKLTFLVRVYDEKELVGKGSHIRFIVDTEKLEKKAEEKKAK